MKVKAVLGEPRGTLDAKPIRRQALSEERERRHKAELLALEVQMQAKLEAMTRTNEDLTRRLSASAAATASEPASAKRDPHV